MLLIVAVKDIEVIASFNVNVAVPEDVGRGWPVVRVGTVGGFSCELVSVAVSTVTVWAAALSVREATKTLAVFNMAVSGLG
jgi:hypothetical protein